MPELNASSQDRESIYLAALRVWGADAQMDMCAEECGELIAALNRFRRGRSTKAAVVEELADVSIMLEQMALIFCQDVEIAKVHKLERLRQRLLNIASDGEGYNV